jgi:hypothetical protein
MSWPGAAALARGDPRADPLQRYVAGGYKEVDGWMTGLAARAIRSIASLQSALDVRGGACEIGVHDGRSFILLQLLTRPDEPSIAFDLFDRQRENVDESGCGSRERFIANCELHRCDMTRVSVCTANSLELTVDAIRRACPTPFRLFSIDGGHTARNADNDLALAAGTVADGGVVLLDDVFNEQWPGVVEGMFRFAARNPSALMPFAIIGNKVCFTTSATWADRYFAHVCADRGAHGTHSKTGRFLDRPVFVSWQGEMSLPQRLVYLLSQQPCAPWLRESTMWRMLGPLVRRTYR